MHLLWEPRCSLSQTICRYLRTASYDHSNWIFASLCFSCSRLGRSRWSPTFWRCGCNSPSARRMRNGTRMAHTLWLDHEDILTLGREVYTYMPRLSFLRIICSFKQVPHSATVVAIPFIFISDGFRLFSLHVGRMQGYYMLSFPAKILCMLWTEEAMQFRRAQLNFVYARMDLKPAPFLTKSHAWVLWKSK